VRGVNHGREHIAELGHADDVLPGVVQVNLPLPGHNPENIQRQQNALGMKRGVGAPQKVCYYLGTLPLRM
jgi:hypothetical protein